METAKFLLRKLASDRTALLGAVIILLLVVVAIAAPILATHPADVAEFHPSERLQGPSTEHFFGTDRMGSDVYSRILFGARITIAIAVIAIGVSVLIGVPIGLLAGYYRNWFSDALMRVSDIFLAVPQIVLAIAIAQTLGPSIENVILALSATYWPFWARLVYAETRSTLNETYIEASVALGASPWRVMLLHVLPNISSSVIVRTTIGMGGTILTAAALGFLGLGPPAPSPEWGRTIAESREFLPEAWWYATAPGLAIFLVVMGFNLLGDGLRDILDPAPGAPAMDDLLTVTDLEVGFTTDSGLARVLDHVNFRIGKGEIVGLVGESGCGKTTLARSILGVLPENSARIGSGRIDFAGRNLLEEDRDTLATELRGREITFVPQDPFSSFNPVFTIGAQIDELMKWKSPAIEPGARPRRYPRKRKAEDRERVIELLRTVQLPDPAAILAKYPHEVSGGQRQRLMIAMALLPEPRLIIADEPTTALDVTIQAQILKLLRRLATDLDASVLFTTHDLGTAYEICDRITVMYAGQEVESAPSDEFFAEPRHPYTTQLLRSLPSRGAALRGIPGSIPSLIDPPSGCRFHPRCELATSECSTSRPGVTEAGAQHLVRCYHPVQNESAA